MAFDVNTMFFDTDNISSTVSSDVIDFHGPDLDEVDYRTVATGDVSGSVVATLETSDDNETFETEATIATITEAGETHYKFRSKKRYRKVTLTSDSGSIEHLEVGMDTASRWTLE